MARATPVGAVGAACLRPASAPMSRASAPPDPVALRSERHLAFFERAFTRFFRRHMRALRLPPWGLPALPAETPVVVFANHPSWWDGVAFMLLFRRLTPDRHLFMPMDADALGRYRFMRRLGVFGVEGGTARGAVAFLRTAEGVLADPRHVLCMNAPGRFCDVRERPVPIAPGLAHLAERAPGAVFVPLALEYPFWTERKPEMLAAFGPPIPAATLAPLDRETRAAALARALEETMDRLAQDAISRDPGRFETLVQGHEGMGGVYEGWRRLRAALSGRPFDPRHDQGAKRAPR
ncbi:MAG TPA: lysophospholipid acyltransferase family protein [Acetobacteraceae bacterium]|nr:lysophospholipid acyltransferase family protein [Acetobacteraceae bacterium]